MLSCMVCMYVSVLDFVCDRGGVCRSSSVYPP